MAVTVGSGTGVTTLNITEDAEEADGTATMSIAVTANSILKLTGDGNADAMAGTITGAGALDIDNAYTFAESVAIGSINIATGKVVVFSDTLAVVGANTVVGTLTVAKAYSATTTTATGTVNILTTDDVTIGGAFADGGTTVLNITNSADNEAANTNTFSGAVAMDTINIGSATRGGKMVAQGIITGNVIVDSGNTSNEVSSISTSKNITGNIALDEVDTNGFSSSLITTGSAAGVIITGTIDAVTAAEGDLVFGNTHNDGTTVTGIVGSTAIGTLTATGNTTFNDNVIVAAIVNSGTAVATYKQTVTATTLKTSATINVTNAAAETITGIITENASGNATKLVVKNSADAEGVKATFASAVTIDAIEVGTSAVGGIAQFNGNVIAALQVAGGNENDEDNIAILNDADLTGNTTLVAGTNAGIATLQTAGTSAMTITGTIAGTGTLDIDNTGGTTVTGAIGTSSTAITSAALANNADIIAKSDVYITSTVLTGAAVLKLDGTAAQVVGSTITAAADDSGDVVVSNTSTTTFNNTIGARDSVLNEIQVENNNTAQFDAAIAAATLNIDGGTIKIMENNNLVGEADTSGILSIAGAPTILLGENIVAGETIFVADEAAAANAVDITGNATVIVPSSFTTGTITLLSQAAVAGKGAIGTEDLAAEALQFVAQDNVLYDYDIAASGTGNINISISAASKDITSVAKTLGTTTNQARGLMQANSAASADSTLLTIFNDNLNEINGGNITNVKALAKQIAPQTDTVGGSAMATKSMTGTVQGIVSNRMASLRSGDAYVTGMSAGNGMSANSGFIQAFGSEGEQKNTSIAGATKFGFDTETSGLALGFDNMTDSGSTIGLSASYSTTDVDGKGTGKSKNSIDSYTVSVYADKASESSYIEGSLTYGINDNTTSRLVNTAGLNRAYSANYDSNQVSLKVGGGVANEVADGTFVTPFVSATASTITTDAYTEKSSVDGDALRLKVAQDDINSFIGTLGVKAHMVTEKGTPMISFSVNNEFGDSKISSSNTYQGGGTKFQTSNKVEELSTTLGLGYSFGNDVTSLDLNYELNANDDEYVNQYGSIKFIAKF